MREQQPMYVIDDDGGDEVDMNCCEGDGTNHDDVTVTIHVHVEGMMCQRNCGSTVTNALLQMTPPPFAAAAAAAAAEGNNDCRRWEVLHAQAIFAEQRAYVTFRCRHASPSSSPSTSKQSLDHCRETLIEETIETIECVGFDASYIDDIDLYLREQKQQQQQQQLQQQQQQIPDRHPDSPLYYDGHGEQNQSLLLSSSSPSSPASTTSSSWMSETATANAASTNNSSRSSSTTTNNTIVIFQVTGMSCAVCTGHVDRALSSIEGVDHVVVTLAMGGRAQVTLSRPSTAVAGEEAAAAAGSADDDDAILRIQDQKVKECQQIISKVGYECAVLSIISPSSSSSNEDNDSSDNLHDQAELMQQAQHREVQQWRALFLICLALTIPVFLLDQNHHWLAGGGGGGGGGGGSASFLPASREWIMLLLSSVVQFYVGRRFYLAAYKGWRYGGTLGMDALIVMGTSASYLYSIVIFIGQCIANHDQMHGHDDPTATTHEAEHLQPTFATGPMLFTFICFGKYLESHAKSSTGSALQTLMQLQPIFASRIRMGSDTGTDGEKKDWFTCPAEAVSASDIKVHDLVRVLPGARIPADGVLVAVSRNKNNSSSSHHEKGLATFKKKAVYSDGYSDEDYHTDGSQKQQEQSQLAYIDESAFSGEPFPVAKGIGDDVYASTVNQLSVLVVRVNATGNQTVLSRICRLVQQAQASKAPIQDYADKVASIFAPTVMMLSLLTFLAWMIFNQHIPIQMRFFMAFMSAISVLVIACPCALGLATPTAVMVGTGVGATHGLLIKGGEALEKTSTVETIIFDKTGTLTTGKAVLGDRIEFIGQQPQQLQQQQQSHDDVDWENDTDVMASLLLRSQPKNIGQGNLGLWLAACAEVQSEHPLAKAIVNAAKSSWGGDVICSNEGVVVDEFQIVPGRGVECLVTAQPDSAKEECQSWYVRVGSRPWTKPAINQEEHNMGVASSFLEDDTTGDEQVAELRRRGQIAVYVSVVPSTAVGSSETTQRHRWRVVSVFGIVDPVQADARSTVAALHRMGKSVWMCSGDHKVTALAVAKEVGIDPNKVCAGATPSEKASLVSRLQGGEIAGIDRYQRRGKQRRGNGHVDSRVAVVGDGINDAVALAKADVGIAIGAGNSVAVEAADIVLVRSSLHDVVVALHLSQVVYRRIMLNFIWAMSYNIFSIPFAMGVLYPFTDFRLPPEVAGLMMAFSSVSVVTSSLLLRRYKRPIIHDDGSMEEDRTILSEVAEALLTGCDRCLVGNRGQPRYEDVPTKQTTDVELV